MSYKAFVRHMEGSTETPKFPSLPPSTDALASIFTHTLQALHHQEIFEQARQQREVFEGQVGGNIATPQRGDIRIRPPLPRVNYRFNVPLHNLSEEL